MAKVPSNIGRYEIVKAIGHGGMGSLYLAWDTKLDRAIAIKVLREDNDDLRERFAREAKSAARLRHPHIVTIFDLGEHEGQPYIAMEYIHGRTLAQIIRERDDMPLGRTLELMAALCDGLAFAHKAGIIHRDVKPANIMIDEEGSLKILDFGIARLTESAGLTQAGMMIGTLNYMSPEQIVGQRIDHRSDIFAVGLVFYELLARKEAFPGTISTGILAKLLHSEPVPLAQACPGLDEDVIRIVGRAIEKDVNRRYQDLTEMRREILTVRGHVEAADDLTRVRETPAPHGPPLKSPSERRASERGEIAQRRASQIESYLDQADRAIREARYESAIAACEHLLMLDAENVRALDLVDRARAAIEARQAKQLLGQAGRDLKAGSLTLAAQRVDEAGLLQPSAEQEQLREEVERAREARERARVARQAAEARRADALIRDARQRFVKGDHTGALSMLDDFTPANESVLNARAELRREVERIDEQRRTDAAAARAKADEPRREAEARAEQAAREHAARERARRDREPPASEQTLPRGSRTVEPAELTLLTVPLPESGVRPTDRPAPRRSLSRGGMIAIGIVVVLLLAGGAYYRFGLSQSQSPAGKPTPQAAGTPVAPQPPPAPAPPPPPIDSPPTRGTDPPTDPQRVPESSPKAARPEPPPPATPSPEPVKTTQTVPDRPKPKPGSPGVRVNAPPPTPSPTPAPAPTRTPAAVGTPSPPATPTPTPTFTDDKSAITYLLRELSNALSTDTNRSRNVNAVRRLWPNAGGDIFADSESQAYLLRNPVFVTLTADRASVDCDRVRSITSRATGKTSVPYDNVRIELRKTKGTWQVDTIKERSK